MKESEEFFLVLEFLDYRSHSIASPFPAQLVYTGIVIETIDRF
jgi:hypothetical protein